VKRKFIILFVVADAVVIAAVGLGLYRYRFSLPRKFAAVEEGVLFRSGQGTGYQVTNAINKHGIKTIICLRRTKPSQSPPWLQHEKQAAREAGVTFLHWPMQSNEPLDEKYMLEFLKMTQDPVRTPILIHCARGEHRAGFFSAYYRMVINNWSKERALREMESLGFDLNTHTGLVAALKRLDVDRIKAKLKPPSTQPIKQRSRL